MSAVLKDANTHDEWRPPTPYTVVIAKKVGETDYISCTAIRMTIMRRMEREGRRIDPFANFLNVPLEIILKAFSLHAGAVYDPSLY
jgi:hypothetical protein